MDTYATNAPFTNINKCNLNMSALNDAFPGKIYNAERWDKKITLNTWKMLTENVIIVEIKAISFLEMVAEL